MTNDMLTALAWTMTLAFAIGWAINLMDAIENGGALPIAGVIIPPIGTALGLVSLF
jgi:hypothetical protein